MIQNAISSILLQGGQIGGLMWLPMLFIFAIFYLLLILPQQRRQKKWQHMTVASESEDTLTGAGDDGGFELRRRGTNVTSVEGLEPAIH